MQYVTNLFGQIYSGCAYGGSSYQNNSCQTTTTTTASAGTGGTSVLTDTGFDILVIATLACTLMLAALLVRFWKRPAKAAPKSGAE